MNKEFVPYEQAFALEELDKPYLGECFGEYRQWDGGKPYLQLYQDLDECSTDPADYEYTTECIAPTYQQAFRFFREKHGFYNQIHKGYGWEGIIRNSVNGDIEWHDGTYNSPEEAELACLIKLIEIVKQKYDTTRNTRT